MVTRENPLHLYRCFACRKLLTDRHIFKNPGCTCGSMMVSGGSPGNLLEKWLCWWWTITLR